MLILLHYGTWALDTTDVAPLKWRVHGKAIAHLFWLWYQWSWTHWAPHRDSWLIKQQAALHFSHRLPKLLYSQQCKPCSGRGGSRGIHAKNSSIIWKWLSMIRNPLKVSGWLSVQLSFHYTDYKQNWSCIIGTLHVCKCSTGKTLFSLLLIFTVQSSAFRSTSISLPPVFWKITGFCSILRQLCAGWLRGWKYERQKSKMCQTHRPLSHVWWFPQSTLVTDSRHHKRD